MVNYENICDCQACEVKRMNKTVHILWKFIGLCALTWVLLIGGCKVGHASVVSIINNDGYIQSYTLNHWANAIYKAENSRKHPYGIMATYKHTSARQACINTVRHQYKNWVKVGHPGAFLGYLARHYAPIGVSNDPKRLNINWANNVLYWLKKGY